MRSSVRCRYGIEWSRNFRGLALGSARGVVPGDLVGQDHGVVVDGVGHQAGDDGRLRRGGLPVPPGTCSKAAPISSRGRHRAGRRTAAAYRCPGARPCLKEGATGLARHRLVAARRPFQNRLPVLYPYGTDSRRGTAHCRGSTGPRPRVRRAAADTPGICSGRGRWRPKARADSASGAWGSSKVRACSRTSAKRVSPSIKGASKSASIVAPRAIQIQVVLGEPRETPEQRVHRLFSAGDRQFGNCG